ncbi:histidinol dehydrogenase [Elizabethkingia anophelis]|uniref:histidinol dehydrogenase n=1 Tax=Elizabethkingia anophelis TaxID=1117645 RepID=UPI0023E9D3C2|nr:histidinol dehydrogenase [Elizabethkingia anophelis]MCT4228172.1 histidinol dehydrogenase [Elizabethkingia anophelis]MCT4238898.1 histidinol dehydrogenase [Elizabethkingia anophelis]MCT4282531.1 histidinol dehydrogenase [Elizabethkingia anophelis]MCT4293116.1 histidinol dehydrogenase [Elizabethkingia anophelis]GJN57831.1 histidinol dehydrogenase [Elizabethkingia anophelis]
MQTYINPPLSEWKNLIQRPVQKAEDLQNIVLTVFEDVKSQKDKALIDYTKKFDKANLTDIRVSSDEINAAITSVSEELRQAIQMAASNIEKFHASQKESKNIIETAEGVNCWREARPIENVGIYIPGGSAPLFSTVLMLGIPAQLAGCKNITLCTPPDENGNINPAILYTANLIGIKNIYKAGGIQAIGAMTFGTETIEKADKIFGPGNQYVTAAKQIAQNFGVAIDMPAGPSEVLVIADTTANPEFVAADLLSQAEHGADSQVILLVTDENILQKTLTQIESQLTQLPRKSIASQALLQSRGIVLDSIEECIAFSNLYAPEHLILAIENTENYTDKITSAGSVFLGNFSCESAGDYASGTNHTLPTNGYARNYSGVSLDSFVKKITFQKVTEKGIQNIGPGIEKMAEAEELFAHKNAVSVRLKSLNSQNNTL